MSYELLIAEKPVAARRIAEALSDNQIIKKIYKKIPYYEITHKKKKILVGCAVGHLFGLKEKNGKGWKYPLFSYEWRPIYEISKKSSFTKNYLDLFKKLVKEAKEYTICTDFDIEGSLIGYNILRFVANKKNANRMKFSTLTDEDLLNSYCNKSKHLDIEQAIAGETRHILDWEWGLSSTRALTLAVKLAGFFKILSSGRVQSPTLYLLAKREEEIKKFKPELFWQLFAQIKAKADILAIHSKGKFTKKQNVEKIIKKCKNHPAILKKQITRQYKLPPPPAFNITSLQTEAYRLFGYSPKQTLQIAQQLYLNAYISYPRTSSEKLDPKINYKKILKALSEFKNLIKGIKSLKPVQGKKKDPAHIAIYPTHSPPKLSELTEQEKKIYKLIVRRFIAAFYPDAVRETANLEFDINKEIFIAKGLRTLKQGWTEIYPATFKENILPELKQNKIYNVKKLILKQDKTKPPNRYSQGSIIAEMEKRNLGTKATRHAILQILYDRHYIEGRSIKVTKLGLAVAETLKKYVPELTSEKLTKHFEQELEKILKKKKKPATILNEAQKLLKKIFNKFKKKEKQIGLDLLKATKQTKKELSVVGKCLMCKKGNLVIRRSKYGQFLACDKYPKCSFTKSLPQGLIKPIDKKCESCGFPQVQVIRKGKRPFNYCINKKCPKKLEWIKNNKDKIENFKKKINKTKS